MKHLYFFIFIFSISGVSISFAAEQIPIDSIAISKNETSLPEISFPNQLGNEKQPIAKVGPAFTEGGDYSGMMLPYLLSYTHPVSYPRWAIRQGHEGKFVLAIEILASGAVGRFHVTQSTGHRLLDEAALRTIKTWKFQPAIKDGKPVKSCIEIPVIFELNQK